MCLWGHPSSFSGCLLFAWLLLKVHCCTALATWQGRGGTGTYFKVGLEWKEVVQHSYKVFGERVNWMCAGCWHSLGRRVFWGVTLGCRDYFKTELWCCCSHFCTNSHNRQDGTCFISRYQATCYKDRLLALVLYHGRCQTGNSPWKCYTTVLRLKGTQYCL